MFLEREGALLCFTDGMFRGPWVKSALRPAPCARAQNAFCASFAPIIRENGRKMLLFWTPLPPKGRKICYRKRAQN